jgi:hypothetical protein
MNKKDSEAALGTMMRGNGYFVHKWRDRGFVSCPTCHTAITICPNCKGSMLLPKAQTLPDFLVAKDYTYVECKQGVESWSITDFSPTQIEVLDSIPKSWVFLLMGTGRAPLGKQAFLIPWDRFKEDRDRMIGSGMKSVRFENTERSKVLTAYALWLDCMLVWEKGAGWKIPIYHSWWGGTNEQADHTIHP